MSCAQLKWIRQDLEEYRRLRGGPSEAERAGSDGRLGLDDLLEEGLLAPKLEMLEL